MGTKKVENINIYCYRKTFSFFSVKSLSVKTPAVSEFYHFSRSFNTSLYKSDTSKIC